MALSLDKLPPELLSQLVTHCENARTLLYLSLTCKRLNEFTRSDGWRIFVQTRFPSLRTPPFWKDAAHSLTTLSRNWDRKAFIARVLQPWQDPPSDRRRPAQCRQRQTMGYQPTIDSYEEIMGNKWHSRKEVLAWGGGAELVLRIRKTGDEARKSFKEYNLMHGSQFIDQHHHLHKWITYKDNGLVDGRDDITTVNILRPWQKDGEASEHIIVGRASGRLDLVAVDVAPNSRVLCNFDTGGRSVRSATVNSSSDTPLIAACLADSAVSLYAATSEGALKTSLDEVLAVPPGKLGRTWSSRFLRHDRLAVGRGPSGQPLLIYSIGEAGFCDSPVRQYDIERRDGEFAPANGAQGRKSLRGSSTSIYPVAPIAPSSITGGAEGDIFLSGGYDGNIRLHDLRSPASSMAIFTDIVDDSAIYSLLPLGQERFVAGASRYAMVKIFDLRMPGGKMYHASNLDPCSTDSSVSNTVNHSFSQSQPCCSYHFQAKEVRSNYNIYLDARGRRTRSDSPVYSLSSPSPYSPTFYAGVENSVAQVDVVSALDRHPDPLYTRPSIKTSEQLDIWRRWDPEQDAINLKLYEQSIGGVTIRTQRRLSADMAGEHLDKGWDERWF